MNILTKIKEERKKQLAKEIKSFQKPSLKKVLLKDGLSIIAEFKKASPSKGIIVEDFNIEEIARNYINVKVSGFSVLTEEKYFHGNNEFLQTLSNAFLQIPILRKDFLFTPFMVAHSKFIGASAVLLIVNMLDKNTLFTLHELALEMDLEVLVEVHNLEELNIALKIPNLGILGINNRNLNTFEVDLQTSFDLLKHIPRNRDFALVSESGFENITKAILVEEVGFDAVLVGEHIIKGNFYD